MPFVDDPNTDNTNAVAGSTPLQQGGGASNMESSPSGDASQAAASGSATMQSSAPQDQQSTSSRKGPASSGMFTNIQKYVQKNQPQAQKMAGAVTQDFSKQAGEIRQAAEAKKTEQANLIGANTKKIGSVEEGTGALGWAKGQVDQIMGTTSPRQLRMSEPQNDRTNITPPKLVGGPALPPPDGQESYEKFTGNVTSGGNVPGTITPEMQQQGGVKPITYNPSEADAAKFSALAGGDISSLGLSNVQDLNLAQQQNRMGALSQLAKGSETEQGRRNLLGSTFQKQGDYSRGMSGLDNLITSGDKTARESLIQGTQGAAKDLGTDLQGLSQEAYENKIAQDTVMGSFGEDITGIASGAASNIDTELENAYNAEIAKRGALTGDFDKSKADLEAWKADKLAQLGDVEDWQNVAGQILNSGTDLGRRGNTVFSGEVAGTNTDGSLARIGENPFKEAMTNIMKGYQYGGDENLTGTYGSDEAWKNIWDTSSSSNASASDQYFDKTAIQDQFRNLQKSISEMTPDELLKQKFAAENAGQSYDDYIKGAGLDKYDTASQSNIDRINALQKLTKTNKYSDDMRNTDYKSTSQMTDFLKKYGNS